MTTDSAPGRTTTLRKVPEARFRDHVAGLFAVRDLAAYVARAQRIHGDICRIRMLGIPLLMINKPEYMQRVLVDNHENYDKDVFLFRMTRPVLRDGLIGTTGGEPWRRQRRLMQPSFHRPKIAAFVTNMTDETAAMLRRWEHEVLPYERADILGQVGHLAMRIVTRSLFGADVGPSSDAIAEDFTEANEILGRYFRFPFPPLWAPTPGHRKLQTLIARLDEYVDAMIEQRRHQQVQTHDLLSVLHAAVDDETGYSMSLQQLHYEVLNLLVGGYETTAQAGSWLLHEIARYPEVQERVRAEVDAELGDRVPTIEDLSRLPYVRATVDETLRLYTPAWQTMRRAIGDDEIDGYRIPAGSAMYLNIMMLHQHRDHWPDPERFDPDRFLPENSAGRQRNTYIPFGAGPRICIGKHFALTELQVILAMVMQRYRLALPPGSPPVRPLPLITLRADAIRLNVTPR